MKRLTLLTCLFVFVGLANASDLKFIASEEIKYDDNIYLTKSDKKDSFISTTRLGALYGMQVPNSSLKANFAAIGGYNAYTEDNGKNGYWDALVQADLANENMSLGDIFVLTSDPANAELTDRAKRINNIAYFNYITSKKKMFSFGVKLSDIYTKYLKDEWEGLNRNRLNLGAGVYYNLSEKTSFFLEYTYTILSYQKNDDSDSKGGTVALGVEGQIAPKIKGTAKATYNYRDYDKSLAGYKNYADLFGFDVSLAWEPTTRNLVRLGAHRNFEETIFTNNRYFVLTGVELYASQKVVEKVTLSLTLGYDNLAYPEEAYGVKRSDDLYTIRPEIGYQIKDWLSSGIWYQYRKRDSNISSVEYDNNRAGIYLKATF